MVSYLFNGGVLGLSVAADGSITAPPGPTSTPSVQSLAVTPDGRFAYAPTRDFMSVPAVGLLGYSIAANGALSPIGGLAVQQR